MKGILLAIAVMSAASGSTFAQDAVIIEVPQPARLFGDTFFRPARKLAEVVNWLRTIIARDD